MTETVTDAKGRKIEVRTMDPGDWLDLYDAAGASSTNLGWVQYASAVMSCLSIDGVPLPKPADKRGIRANANTLGNDGVLAVTLHFYGKVSEQSAAPEQVVDAAKN